MAACFFDSVAGPETRVELHFLLDVSDVFLDVSGFHAAGIVGSDRFVSLQGFI